MGKNKISRNMNSVGQSQYTIEKENVDKFIAIQELAQDKEKASAKRADTLKVVLKEARSKTGATNAERPL